MNAGKSQALCHLELGGRTGEPSRKAGRETEAGTCLPLHAASHPVCQLEGPSAQSFENAHSACMVHLGTKALNRAAPPGPYQCPLNGELDLS